MSTYVHYKFNLTVHTGLPAKMGEAQWFISWEEFKTIPPSLKHLSLVEEIDNRRIGTEFIDKLGHAIGM